ncbi:MAG: protein kinase [Myxococcales bacterium]|nr:protein kinase [Polyangiaceae bacterium]MDW8249954.1 protein kinase [Myxococcales bacterium]
MFTPGTLLAGKYELLEIAGQGGMATVWRARSRGVGGFSKNLAIKVMLQRLCSDCHFIELFIEEARVSSQLQHPNIVQIYDFGEHNGVYFLAMEWVDGLDLLDYYRSFTNRGYFMPWAALAILAVEVLKGLHAAHTHHDEQGNPSPIFHRDVTPHNILLGVNGVVKLADFGLAKATDRGTMTLPRVLKGKISYTAPEMTRGVRANARTDIFSLGVTLWEALAGRKMFDAVSPLQVIKQIQAWSIPPLRELRPDLPLDLILIVERAVARDPEERYASAQEFAVALSRLLPPLPDLQRLGKSVAEARQRMRQGKEDNLSHLKEALRPAVSTQASSFRPALSDGRAARTTRAVPPLPGQPASSPPVHRPSSTPPLAFPESTLLTSAPILSSSLADVRISEQLPSLPRLSVVPDERSVEHISSAEPKPISVSQPSLSISVTWEDSSVASSATPPTQCSPPVHKPPVPHVPPASSGGRSAAVKPPPTAVALRPSPSAVPPAPVPPHSATLGAAKPTRAAQAAPPPRAPLMSVPRKRHPAPGEPSCLDISIELELNSSTPNPCVPPPKKKLSLCLKGLPTT